MQAQKNTLDFSESFSTSDWEQQMPPLYKNKYKCKFKYKNDENTETHTLDFSQGLSTSAWEQLLPSGRVSTQIITSSNQPSQSNVFLHLRVNFSTITLALGVPPGIQGNLLLGVYKANNAHRSPEQNTRSQKQCYLMT